MRKAINFQLIIIFVVLVFISFCCIGYTAGEILTWDKLFGGIEADMANSIIQTEDGGYALAGKTKSIASGEKAWVIKLNTRGNKVEDNTFAKRTDDEIFSIIQTQDGGYAVCGFTESKGAGGYDAWVIKLDEKGNLE